MNKQIYDEIMKIEEKGLSSIDLLALVTETSYEVIFYAKYNNKVYQSNDLVENGILTSDFVDNIYEEVANIIRMDKKYDPEKLNIVKAFDDYIVTEHEEKNCRVYALKKKWKKEIGL